MKNRKKKTVIGLTLGCRLNQADTALIFGQLEKAGFSIIKPTKGCNPDLIVLNTCTVTANAARKSRQTARQFKHKYPDACLIVTGCDCNKALSGWNLEDGVDFALPNSQKKDISEIATKWLKASPGDDASHRCNCNSNSSTIISSPSTLKKHTKESEEIVFTENTIAKFPFRSRAFLKVQEGCNSFCTYCIVPHVRGRERSRAFNEVINEAKEFIKRGYREIVITGINISTYSAGNKKIVDLLEAIVALPGDFRIRLSSLEPHSENRNLVALIKNNSKICRFLHIPLQSGSDEILAKMNRNYTSAEFAEFAEFALNTIPGLHLGTDIIVGFPGESDEIFQETCEFIKKIDFANIHLFRFSPREGTPAATYPHQVPHHIIKQRVEILAKIAEKSKEKFIRSQIGKVLPVLLEKKIAHKTFEGWSDNYIRILLSDNDNLQTGEIFSEKMTLSNFYHYDIFKQNILSNQ